MFPVANYKVQTWKHIGLIQLKINLDLLLVLINQKNNNTYLVTES